MLIKKAKKKKKKNNKRGDYSLLQGERKLKPVRQRSGGLTWQFKKKKAQKRMMEKADAINLGLFYVLRVDISASQSSNRKQMVHSK